MARWLLVEPAMALSPEHEIPAELFRSCPELARELLRSRGIILPPGTAELSTIDATQSIPTEARADVVIVIRDAHGDPMHAIVVEIQTTEDGDKLFTWPLYLATLRSRLRCPALLLVLATSTPVARWAREPIDLGHPGHVLVPTVIGFEDVPSPVAADPPELAVLSARASPDRERVYAAVAAIRDLPEDRRRLYLNFLFQCAPELVKGLETSMTPEMREQLWKDMAFKWGLMEGREEEREKRIAVMRAIAEHTAKKLLGDRYSMDTSFKIQKLDETSLQQFVFQLLDARDGEVAQSIVAQLE
jgi:hypothetical protein